MLHFQPNTRMLVHTDRFILHWFKLMVSNNAPQHTACSRSHPVPLTNFLPPGQTDQLRQRKPSQGAEMSWASNHCVLRTSAVTQNWKARTIAYRLHFELEEQNSSAQNSWASNRCKYRSRDPQVPDPFTRKINIFLAGSLAEIWFRSNTLHIFNEKPSPKCYLVKTLRDNEVSGFAEIRTHARGVEGTELRIFTSFLKWKMNGTGLFLYFVIRL